jgi:hypothetical protein
MGQERLRFREGEPTVKKLLIVPVAMALACGGTSSGDFSKDSARNAMPNSVAMSTPGGTASSAQANPNALTATPAATSNDFYFGLTVSVAVVFNVPVATFLGLVDTITQAEPTSCTSTSCTWGPGSGALEANTYKLVVSLDADGSYDWELDGQAKSKPASNFVTIVSGKALPSGTPHHGSGSFTVNFDNANTLDGVLANSPTGKMVVSSYSNVGPAQLAVTYMGVTDASTGDAENIAYSYADNTTGGGDLQFAVHNTTTADDFSVHSRWKNDGEGRSDVQGSGGGLTVKDSDCWGAAPFLNVYFTSSITVNAPPFAGPTTGNPSACAFSDAAYSSLTVQ